MAEATTGSGELVELEPIAGTGAGARTRLSANLTPRARIDVSWRVEAAPGTQLPPLLTMQGEIAIDIDSGSFRTQSTWAVHAVRGTTRMLELRLDPADEVLEFELDGQPVLAGIETRDGAVWLTIVLNDPLRPGLPKSLVMTTRRTIAPASRAGISFGGFPLTNAKEQSGAIGIAQHGNLWVGGHGRPRAPPDRPEDGASPRLAGAAGDEPGLRLRRSALRARPPHRPLASPGPDRRADVGDARRPPARGSTPGSAFSPLTAGSSTWPSASPRVWSSSRSDRRTSSMPRIATRPRPAVGGC